MNTCPFSPAWKKGALQPSPVLKPNEKAPPAGESLPLSFPCVLCVGTVTRFSCGSHRPAYSWLTTAKKKGHGGLAAGCPGPTNAKRDKVLAQKKKKVMKKHPLGNCRWSQRRLSTEVVLNSPLAWLGHCGSPTASCASPFQHPSFWESPMGEPVLHARSQSFT